MPRPPAEPRVGRRAGPTASFAADPGAWLEHVDELLARDPRLVLTLPPETWVDPSGHAWRVVATAEGPEVRPGLESPFIRQGVLPQITALLVTADGVRVELSMRGWREIVAMPIGSVPVRHLGLAMLAGVELPHEGLDRIGPQTWEAAVERWRATRDRRVAIEIRDGRSAT